PPRTQQQRHCGRHHQRLRNQGRVLHGPDVPAYGATISGRSATNTFAIPGSKRGWSVPGSLGPPGTMPTHSSAPASMPRYHVSPREASETAGASGFGAPNSTRCTSTASVTAVSASPTATANAPTGWVLNAPKNVMTLDMNVAISGTPSNPSAAITVIHASFGMRGPTPLSRAMLRVWARSATVVKVHV